MMNKDKLFNYLDYILPIYFVIALPEMYFGLWGISVYVKYIAFVILLLIGMRVYVRSNNYMGFKQLFTSYFVYCLFSIIWYAVNGAPIKCYLNEIYNSVPAMFFVYIGMTDTRSENKFYKRFLYACTISMVLGIWFYITTPGWFMARRTEYINMQANAKYTYTEDDILQQMRFSSYLGDTYEVDVYAILAMSIALFYLFQAYKKNESTIVIWVCVLVNFIAAILCQQRVAMAYSVLVIGVFIYCGIKYNNKSASKKLITIFVSVLTLIILLAVFYFGDRAEYLTSMLSDRMDNMSVSKALGERDYQLDLLRNHWFLPIFGHGIGSGGATAGFFGLPHVNDCSYIEILYETGIVGFLIFLLIMFKTTLRGLRYIRYYIVELMIIGFCLVACIGSNTLTIGFLSIFPFWYSIGRIWNKEHFEYITNNNISI